MQISLRIALCLAAIGMALTAQTTVSVSPSNMNGWVFSNDQPNGVGTGTLVNGPGAAPLNAGSARLALAGSGDGQIVAAPVHQGVRLDQLTTLEYSTYRSSADAGNNLAIALQLNVDYDLTDANTSWQGRLVFEPYHTFPGGVPQGVWQTWDALVGKWWASRSPGNVHCPQSSPCTLPQILSYFPNAGIHATFGAVVLKAGSGWASFDGNVDELTIGIGGLDTTYDFEENLPPVAQCVSRIVNAGPACNATASIDDGSYDPEGLALTLTQTPPGPYAIGSSAVDLDVSDGQFTSSCQATVKVEDATAPTIGSVTASPSVIKPPNNKMVPVTVAATATDCQAYSCRIIGITANETLKPGDVSFSGLTASVKADRDGKGTGRVYTLTVECKDAADNASTRTVTVTVPHDQGK